MSIILWIILEWVIFYLKCSENSQTLKLLMRRVRRSPTPITITRWCSNLSSTHACDLRFLLLLSVSRLMGIALVATVIQMADFWMIIEKLTVASCITRSHSDWDKTPSRTTRLVPFSPWSFIVTVTPTTGTGPPESKSGGVSGKGINAGWRREEDYTYSIKAFCKCDI